MGPKNKGEGVKLVAYDGDCGEGGSEGGVLRRRGRLVELRAWLLLWENRSRSMWSMCRI